MELFSFALPSSWHKSSIKGIYDEVYHCEMIQVYSIKGIYDEAYHCEMIQVYSIKGIYDEAYHCETMTNVRCVYHCVHSRERVILHKP